MGLMQFLTVGRSLGRISDHPSRYKMTQQNLLPKFGSPKRTDVEHDAEKPAKQPEPPTTSRNQVPTNKPIAPHAPFGRKAGTIAKAKFVSKILRRLKFKKSMKTIEIQSPSSAASAEPRQAFPLGRWTMFTTVSLFKNPFGKAPAPKAAQPPLQTELLLDAIKPVRNDLSDCDLEIVPTERRASETRAATPVERTDCAPEALAGVGVSEGASEVAWDRIKTQVFGAGKP